MAKLQGLVSGYGYTISPAIVIGILLSTFFLYKLVFVLRDPLRTVPGPFFARFTRLWYLKAVWHGKFEKTNIALHKKYGIVATKNFRDIDGC